MKMIKVILALITIMVIVAFLYSTNHLNSTFCGLAIVFYSISLLIHLIAHECGHLIGGIISGYKLLYFQVGPFRIFFDEGKMGFSWEKSLVGQCVMVPYQRYPLKFKAYNLGGIYANLTIIILCSALWSFHSFWSSLLFLEIFLVGTKKILINAIPYKSHSVVNDGYTVMLLKKGDAVQKDYAMYLNLYSKILLNKPIIRKQYIYERENYTDRDELLYYTEIQDMLKSYREQNSR